MKLPRIQHKKIEELSPNFYRAIDQRSEKEATLEVPKCGYEYYLHEDPKERALKQIDRNHRKMQRLLERLRAEGLAAKLIGPMVLKSPEESKRPNG